MACKWIDNRSVLFYHLSLKEWMTYCQSRGEKRVARPNLGFAWICNSVMGGVDLMDQCTAAYRLDRKLSFRFYLCIFFHLMDIACVNSYLIYNMKHPNKLFLLDYKIVATKSLIQYLQGRKRAVPMSRPSEKKNQPELIDNYGVHLPDYQMMRKQPAYCAMEGKENRRFVICLACNISLCLVKERNCFQKYRI